MYKFKIALLSLFLPVFLFAQVSAKKSETKVDTLGGKLNLSNSLVSIQVDLENGQYSVTDKKDNVVVFENAGFVADGWNFSFSKDEKSWRRAQWKQQINWSQKPVVQSTKNGIRIELSYKCLSRQLPEYRLAITLVDGDSRIIFQSGINNTQPIGCRFTKTSVFSDAKLYPGSAISAIQTLNGAAGITMPEVLNDTTRESNNSMMLTSLVNGKRRSIVWGGLHYEYYYATSSYKLDKKKDFRSISLSMNDPIGRKIEPNEEWWSPDTYYLAIGESNPFLALEQYGLALREANNAKPNVYDFPTLCGWAVGSLSKGKDINNSAALIDEMDQANKCGITKYTKVAVRLEPDSYCYKNGNTEQGWWDDAHWSKFGHLVKPYDTFAKWCAAVKVRNGIPFTYFQSNMPSDDFAKAHPDWMLGKDISKLNTYHPHHQPLVRMDYTNPAFQQYMLSVWKRLRADGMVGIKFDYPETAWCPSGGFADPKATTTSAYRETFQLCREGLGPDARIHERALGESNAPTLDVCAGIVDIQRNAWDNNKFETPFITTSGLRWYKARSVFSYYPDSKAIHPLKPDIRKSLVTMLALTSGRLELATPFAMLTPDMVHDISRIYPIYFGLKSPRPIDAFTGGKNPQIYDLELTPDWHQVALFNGEKANKTILVTLDKPMVDGGLALNSTADYYVYDFWKDAFVGKVKGTETIKASIDSMACGMYSVRKVQAVPQLLSTNRHILQGWMDTKDLQWNKSRKALSGKASVIAGEPFRLVIASNNWKLVNVTAVGATAKWENHPSGDNLKVLVIESAETKDVSWSIIYKK